MLLRLLSKHLTTGRMVNIMVWFCSISDIDKTRDDIFIKTIHFVIVRWSLFVGWFIHHPCLSLIKACPTVSPQMKHYPVSQIMKDISTNPTPSCSPYCLLRNGVDPITPTLLWAWSALSCMLFILHLANWRIRIAKKLTWLILASAGPFDGIQYGVTMVMVLWWYISYLWLGVIFFYGLILFDSIEQQASRCFCNPSIKIFHEGTDQAQG